jgi:plasmid stabilization system protein ParE
VLRVLPEARVDSIESALWYHREQAGLGQLLLNEIEFAIQRIGDFPKSYPRWALYDGPDDIRRFFVKRFPYSLIYRYRPEETLIVAVAHMSREPFFWLERIEAKNP